MNEKVTEYIAKQAKWTSQLTRMRKILLATELEETLKWGMPTYTIDNKNVIGLSGFKNHYGLWFHQGVFLSDKYNLLRNAQEGKTKAMRQIRITESDKPDLKKIKEYVIEAIQNLKNGKQITNAKPAHQYKLFPLLATKLNQSKPLKTAFGKLSIARQKAYSDYISDAKRSTTKIKRIDEIVPMIRAGKSLNEKYAKGK